MRKKWLVLLVALMIAATLVFSVACNDTHVPVVTVQDGYVYVDGNKTDIQVPDTSDTPGASDKTAFELWKEANPGYTGTEQDWINWLQQLLTPPAGGDDGNGSDKKEETMEYKLIEKGVFKGVVTSGSASTQSSALRMNNAILRLKESVVLPFGEDASWEINVTGKLLTGSATGAQLFVGNPFSEFGRVYIGVNKNSKMVYVGVRLNTTYVNYGWSFDDASVFGANHSYSFSYEDGDYYLSVDGATKLPMSDVNYNQGNQQWLGKGDTANLTQLVRTVVGQDYVEMTNIGVNEFACTSEISNFSVKTSAIGGYRRLLSHPLAGTKIFYLGSSITYGYASGGVAFGEIINKISGNSFAKEAVSGTTLVNNGSDSYVQRLKKLDFSQKPDFLVVQLSTNDFSQNKPLGTVQDGTSSSSFDTSTVSGAIQYIIAYAKEQCPTVKVVFYTGAVRGSWGYRSAYENYVNGDFAKICEKWDIEPLDIFHSNYKDYSFYWSDDIHPTIEGYAAGWTPLFVQYFESHL